MVNCFLNFLLCTHLALYLHNTGGGSAKKKINPSALLFCFALTLHYIYIIQAAARQRKK